MRLLRNALNSRSIATSEPFGLPTGSLTLMCLISANPESSQADLAEYAGITGPRLVSVFDELERRGLVQRKRSETDRRRNLMTLTPKGERTMLALYSKVKHIEDAVRDELGPDGLAKFIDYLDRSVAALAREDISRD